MQLAVHFTFQVVEKLQVYGLLDVCITEAVWQVLHGGKTGSPYFTGELTHLSEKTEDRKRQESLGKERNGIAIYGTGDTHGGRQLELHSVDGFMHRLSTAAFPEQNEMSKEDFVIIRRRVYGLFTGLLPDHGISLRSAESLGNEEYPEKEHDSVGRFRRRADHAGNSACPSSLGCFCLI